MKNQKSTAVILLLFVIILLGACTSNTDATAPSIAQINEYAVVVERISYGMDMSS